MSDVVATARLRSRNQLTLPDPIVQAAGLDEGATFVVELDPDDPDVVRLRRVRSSYAGLAQGLYEPSAAYIEGERSGWEPATPTALDVAIPAGATILLDTSAVLAYLSGAEGASKPATSIIDGFVASGRNPAVLSAITVTEALVRPLGAASPTAARLVEDFLLQFPNLRVDPVSVVVAREAARIGR